MALYGDHLCWYMPFSFWRGIYKFIKKGYLSHLIKHITILLKSNTNNNNNKIHYPTTLTQSPSFLLGFFSVFFSHTEVKVYMKVCFFFSFTLYLNMETSHRIRDWNSLCVSCSAHWAGGGIGRGDWVEGGEAVGQEMLNNFLSWSAEVLRSRGPTGFQRPMQRDSRRC